MSTYRLSVYKTQINIKWGMVLLYNTKIGDTVRVVKLNGDKKAPYYKYTLGKGVQLERLMVVI